MASTHIHQAIHGYRDGHKLLSSSIPLDSDAARAMLILSDMSGPSMQPGFDEYLTGYPLAGTDYFAFAKTWYAPEMQRPGCVWTHSLLIPRAHVASVSVSQLRMAFRRPQAEGVDAAATVPIAIEHEAPVREMADGFGDRDLAAVMIGAVLGQPRPVIVVADMAAQFEPVFLRLWEELWPAERIRFSFCTGALMPRANAGVLLDLQAVPRATPPSQFRRSASSALLLDVRAPNKPEAWVDLVLDCAAKGDATFRTWLEAAAGADAGRAVVPTLAPLFGEWNAPGSTSRSALRSVVSATHLDEDTRNRLIGMVFDRANKESGATGRRELLYVICAHRDLDLAPMASALEIQTKRLFEESRSDGVALILSLLGSDLTEGGERVLRTAVVLLVPNDVETFGEAQSTFLPTIACANPALAQSPILWQRVGNRAIDVLSQLSGTELSDDARRSVIDAIFKSGHEVSVDAIVHFGGKVAILRALTALALNQIHFSLQWKTALSAHPNIVIEWLESLSSPSMRDLELSSRFVNPQTSQERLATVWKNGTLGASSLAPRVAAFGLALALWESDVQSPLLAACFQPTYDAASSARIDYEEWDWLKDHAPSMAWYRDWDRCERLAGALARMLAKCHASLETVFGIVHTHLAIRKVAAILGDEKNMRPYLKALRRAAESSYVGTSEQREALLQDW